MFKRNFISLILLLAFFMLQAHNMMPHQHDVPKTHTHSHDDNHHHDDGAPANPLDEVDHSAEFGKAVIKPSNAKYEISQLKFIPFLQRAYQKEISGLFKVMPQVSPTLPDYLIPPDPHLHGLDLRGPPSII